MKKTNSATWAMTFARAAARGFTFGGRNERVAEVVQDGMQATQTVSGDLEGALLWDPARSLMVQWEEAFEMDGMY